MRRDSERILRFIQARSQSRWIAPLIAGLSALDAFLLVIPNDALLIAAVLAQPRRWIRSSLWITLGSTFGAVVLAGLVSRFGEDVVRHVMPGLWHSQHWDHFEILVHRHGVWGLTLASLGPLPQYAAVAIAGLSHMPLWQVAIGVFLGRFVKYLFLAWCAAHAPKLLRKLKILPRT